MNVVVQDKTKDCHRTEQGLSVSDGDLDLHTRFDGDGGDLLDDLGGRVKVDHALVDAHLEAVPRLGALAARGLPRRDPAGRRMWVD